ncbi:43kDa postsynaptic protein [Senna tora]|uniref:43kDa postsynaptic protein n=1 Tax=Senna tora TaxID=362788 RepID=A0A835C5Z2_9FABA|nr:43kDa postsynaptic protein [Senna tora]
MNIAMRLITITLREEKASTIQINMYHNDFDFYAFDPKFPPPDHSLHARRRGGGGHDGEFSQQFESTIFQCVEQSQVMGHSDLVSEVLIDSSFGIIDGHCDVGIDGLGMY